MTSLANICFFCSDLNSNSLTEPMAKSKSGEKTFEYFYTRIMNSFDIQTFDFQKQKFNFFRRTILRKSKRNSLRSNSIISFHLLNSQLLTKYILDNIQERCKKLPYSKWYPLKFSYQVFIGTTLEFFNGCYLEQNSLLIQEQSGFIKNRRTDDNIFFFIQKIVESFNKKKKIISSEPDTEKLY
ncbi:hypothetical protein BpHYR1_034459 [Brachionus plicatilis]|uniref:Uncharacterized protein n=1 Tax=Brachionus plicatilis TaxID=10195 RepID=A0A3M7SCD2_BRAPC|nr:hypothetical protein BpHYR1_034459 [Brachionus plicatilis]